MTKSERVEAIIRTAFAGVTREGGVSWRESVVADLYGYDPGDVEDNDSTWTELIDDPAWNYDKGVGGPTFLDPIGYRYYLAPAMIRQLRGEYYGQLRHWLTLEIGNDIWQEFKEEMWRERTREMWSALTPDQFRAIAEFVRVMAERESVGSPAMQQVDEVWKEAWLFYWKDIAEGRNS